MNPTDVAASAKAPSMRCPARRNRPATSRCRSVIIGRKSTSQMRIAENGPIAAGPTVGYAPPQPCSPEHAATGASAHQEGDHRVCGGGHQHDGAAGGEV